MSYDPEEARMDAAREEYEAEIGAQYLREFGYELYPEHSAEAIKGFTAERLQSYYVGNPNLATPALEALLEAQSLLSSHPRASLVMAATAMELAVKVVLLKPIVFGLVHIEGLAGFITELATKHTGMERFRHLLTAILAQFGGVDLKTLTRPGSTKTLWKEMEDVQTVRNGAIHRGEAVSGANASLAVALASTLLKELFPQVLSRLDLHLHDPGLVCGKLHGVSFAVYFPVPGYAPSMSATVELAVEDADLDNMPEIVTGRIIAGASQEDIAALRLASPGVPMWITSTLVQYSVNLASSSTTFTGVRVVDAHIHL
jgi:hypothetical protein